jgi:pyruvate dehydrogenase E2 component (dihydrolipoamide acetyltransferase)
MPEVIMPKMGDAMEEGTLLSWKKQDGDSVKAGDVIAEIETDKSNVEVEAEDSGVFRVQVQPGATVPVGTVIATIGDVKPPAAPTSAPAKPAATATPATATPATATPATATPATASTPAPVAVSAPPPSANGSDRERVKASPLARRIAREHGFDIAQITGTGPLGRIVEADVLAFASSSQAAVQQASAAPQARTPSTPPPTTMPTDLSAIRKVIAKRMVESKTTIPHFYITAEIDMAEAIALREKLNAYDETLVKISFNDMIVKASAKALVKVPAANAMFRDDKIYPGAGVHVGIAVALDDGLIVPVVKDADKLPLRQVAEVSKFLIKKARDKKLMPTDYSGGTFTVSNLGSFDVENFIAIIDPSQGAILAVSSIVKKAVVLADDTIAVSPRMNVTFSGDHRVMDGATGAKFLQELKRLLQNPLSLME